MILALAQYNLYTRIAHAIIDQATIDRIAAELRRKFQVKSMVATFGTEKASRTPAVSGVTILSKADGPQTPEEKENIFNVPIPGGREGAHVDGNDDASHIVCVVRAVARFCGNPGLAHKNRVR